MSVSDISLTAGMRNNLLALQNTSAALTQTQNRLSSGKKVNSALDNPTNFFSAQSHLQRASDLGDRKDGMSEGIQTAKAADAGITSITSLIQAAKGLASSALGTTDVKARASFQDQYNTLRGQIDTLAQDSGYKGTNLLKSATLTVQFNEKTDLSTLTIQGFDASTAATGLNIAGATKLAASAVASGDAGAALQTASTTLDTIKKSFDAAINATAALTAASVATTAVQNLTGAKAAETASAAALAAADTMKNIDATASGLLKDAGDTLHAQSLNMALATPGADPIGTAIADLGAYAVDTTAAVAAADLASLNATAAEPAATAGNDAAVGAALTASATALDNVSAALGTIGGLANLAAATPLVLTTAATAATTAAADGVAVTDSGAGWGSSITVGNAAITASSNQLDGALTTLRTQSSALAANLSVVTTRQDFTSSMISTLTQGADNLTLADMNQEGANMLMLQTRQSLSTTALSLSSQAAQSILKLF